jgi:hypothetical protein
VSKAAHEGAAAQAPTTIGPSPRIVGVGLAVMDQLLLWQDASAPVAGNHIVQHDTQGGGMVATGLVAVARLGGRP